MNHLKIKIFWLLESVESHVLFSFDWFLFRVTPGSSRRGGIGVENLQGSGLIAGETSRAYQEMGDPVDPG